MLGLILAVLAMGREPTNVDQAWLAYDRDVPAQGLAVVSEILSEDPSNWGAHRIRAWLNRKQGTSRNLVDLLEHGLLAEDSPEARGALAAALAVSVRSGDEETCSRIEELLATDGTELQRYHVLRTRMDAANACERSRDELLQAMSEMRVAEAKATVLATAIRDSLPSELPSGLKKLCKNHPAKMASLAPKLFDKELEVTPELKKAREIVVAVARSFEGSGDLYRVHYAFRVHQAARNGRTVVTKRKLDELLGTEPMPVGKAARIRSEITLADKRPTHELALEGLDELREKLPEDGPTRAMWLSKRIVRLEGVGRDDDAYAAVRERSDVTEDLTSSVHEMWARAACERGEDVEAALSRLEASLAAYAAESWDPTAKRAKSYDAWQARRKKTLQSWNMTRVRLLISLDRPVEARGALHQILANAPDHAEARARLGLLVRDEVPVAALQHLVAAYTSDELSEELGAEVRLAMESLYASHGSWHPGGLDGYLSYAVEAALEARDAKRKKENKGSAPVKKEHPLLGRGLPVSEAKGLGGADAVRLEHDGILVVDLWATWCGPCVAGMPHLAEVQKAYKERGVRVVGLSVDKSEGAVQKFFKGASVDYDLGFLGKAGFGQFKVSSIPALFVVQDGEIKAYIKGYKTGDTRLEEALDKLLR